MPKEVDSYGVEIEDGDYVIEQFVGENGELEPFIYEAGSVPEEELERRRKERDEKFPDLPD